MPTTIGNFASRLHVLSWCAFFSQEKGEVECAHRIGAELREKFTRLAQRPKSYFTTLLRFYRCISQLCVNNFLQLYILTIAMFSAFVYEQLST